MSIEYKNNKLSELIESQLPNFLQEDGPKFITFVEKYYEWMETSKLEVSVDGNLNLDFSQSVKIKATKQINQNQNIKYVYAQVINSFELENGNYVFYIKEYNDDPKQSQTRGFVSGDDIDFVEGSNGFTGTIQVVSYIQNVNLSSKNVWNLQDIDRTLDEYVDFFMKEFIEGYPLAFPSESESTDIDVPEFKKFLVKNSRDFYQSKGTVDSFKYFFRTIFNQEVEIHYPKDNILKPSDNTYLKTKSILLNPNLSSIPDIVSKRIVGSDSGTKAYVESIVSSRLGGYEVFEIVLNEFGISGDFQDGENIFLEDDNTLVIGSAHKGALDVQIFDTEEVFDLEQPFFIDRNGQLIEQKNIQNIDLNALIELRVCDVHSGNITEIDVITGGSGYSVGDIFEFDNQECFRNVGPRRPITATVSEIDSSGSITKVKVHCVGKNYIKFPKIVKIGNSDITSETFRFVGSDIGKLKFVKVVNRGIKYTGSDYYDIDLNSSGSNNIRVNLGCIFNDGGRFLNRNSFVSDTKYIQDSFYYQTYSYLLKISSQVYKFKDLLKRLVHPAGTEMFGEYSIEKREDVKISLKDVQSNLEIVLWDYIGKYSNVLIRDFDFLYDLMIVDGNYDEPTTMREFQTRQDDADGSDSKRLIPNVYYHGSYACDYLYNENTHQNYRYKIKYKNLRTGTLKNNDFYKWDVLQGTVDISLDSHIVNGVDTNFTQLIVGDVVAIDSQLFTITNIISDIKMMVNTCSEKDVLQGDSVSPIKRVLIGV